MVAKCQYREIGSHRLRDYLHPFDSVSFYYRLKISDLGQECQRISVRILDVSWDRLGTYKEFEKLGCRLVDFRNENGMEEKVDMDDANHLFFEEDGKGGAGY